MGQPAPAFEVKDAVGKLVKLSDFKGGHVALEWTDPSCPFVEKHYGSQNMQGLQKDAVAQGVAWLSISSTAPGHSEYLAPQGMLVYAGGIDDKRSTDPADVATAWNFVKASLNELPAGSAVSTPASAAHGCSIKYRS